MPWGFRDSSSNLHGLNSGGSSGLSSAPPSRPSSPGPGSYHPSLPPSRQGSFARPSALNINSREGSHDPLSEFYGPVTPSTPGFAIGDHDSSQPSTPSVASSYSNSYFGNQGMSSLSSSQGANSHSGHSGKSANHMEIVMDTDFLVMRGAGADTNPVLMSGEVVLNLTESTNIRNVDLRLEGKAKVAFMEGSGSTGSKSHHYTHTFLTHDWSLLQGSKNHYHTLKAGRHAFPFNFTLEGNLPSSLRTYLNDAAITYKLRATAIRSTFQTNYHAQKSVTVVRGYTNEALEYNQTLEIENTWPGKIMYCLTLPHKAYAAGDEIPVSIKFMPLAKGTRVTSVSSIIKEYSLVHTRHSSHSESRIAASTKHELRDGRAYRVNERGSEPVAPSHHGRDEDGNLSGMVSAPPSQPPSPSHRPVRDYGLGHVTPISDAAMSRVNSHVSLSPHGSVTPAAAARDGPSPLGYTGYFPPGHVATPSPTRGVGVAGPSTQTVAEIPDDIRDRGSPDIDIGDEEIDTMITIPIPVWTTPSHGIYPVFVTHKIKWSCAISNPDGHVSELRCALPIVILPNTLLSEAQAATSATRNLLFGGAADTETQAVDLPSYNDHVYDRIAALAPGPSTYIASGHRTPGITPPASRGPSRPASPTRGLSMNGNLRGHHTPETVEEGPDDVPARPELSNWADAELLLSLGALANANNSTVPGPSSGGHSPHETPPDSRTPSRPGSRLGVRSGRSSQNGSRAGSRASSPERPPSIATVREGESRSRQGSTQDGAMPPPPPERRSSHGIPSLFHLPSSIKPFTSVRANQRTASSTALSSMGGLESPRGSPHLRPQHLGSLPRSTFSLGSHAGFTQLAQNSQHMHPGGSMTPPIHSAHAVDPLSQVPSYAIASRGFLGGGVVPISSGPPTYADSERMLDRTRSEGALDQMGREGEEAEGEGVNGTSLAAAMELLATVPPPQLPASMGEIPPEVEALGSQAAAASE